MKKQLVILGIIALLVCVGLSGCNEIKTTFDTDKTTPDGIKITGDVNQINILNYTCIKERFFFVDGDEGDTGDWKSYIVAIVPWDFNITGIENNLTKRKTICLDYMERSEFLNGDLIWDEDYFGYTYISRETHYSIRNFQLDENVYSWNITGIAKNIGNDFLNNPMITINFYNPKGAWLASESAHHEHVPSGYTWNFNVNYYGEFRNDVSYISFEVKAK